jgi:structural maintenance of chromosome 1
MKRWLNFPLSLQGLRTCKFDLWTITDFRLAFEADQVRTTRERLAQLESTKRNEERNVKKLLVDKVTVEEELEGLQADIDRQRTKLENAITKFEEATAAVEDAREAARRTQKALDKALKEIAGWNDDIERSSSDRHAIYRKCRLDGIDLPLVSGSLARVPIEDDVPDMDMDVDDEDGTQRPAKTNDYGVEPDFSVLEEEEKDVSRSNGHIAG